MNFAKGLITKEIDTKYGKIIALSINKEKFLENEFKDGWLNINLKRAKSGDLYAEINNFTKK